VKNDLGLKDVGSNPGLGKNFFLPRSNMKPTFLVHTYSFVSKLVMCEM